MRQICCRTFNRIRSEEFYNYLKQLDEYYSTSTKDFNDSSLKHMIDSEHENSTNYLNRFIDECKTMAVDSRFELFQMNLQFAEQEKISNNKAYETQQQTMWDNLCQDTTDEQISLTIKELIEERCQKIKQLLTCIYEYKSNIQNLSTYL